MDYAAGRGKFAIPKRSGLGRSIADALRRFCKRIHGVYFLISVCAGQSDWPPAVNKVLRNISLKNPPNSIPHDMLVQEILEISLNRHKLHAKKAANADNNPVGLIILRGQRDQWCDSVLCSIILFDSYSLSIETPIPLKPYDA